MIPLTAPPIKSITLKFPHGKEVVARNMKGLTIGDALSAIHKANKNRVSSCDLVGCGVVTNTIAYRLMMSWITRTSRASHGNKAKTTLRFTCKASPQQACQAAAAVARRRRRARTLTSKYPSTHPNICSNSSFNCFCLASLSSVRVGARDIATRCCWSGYDDAIAGCIAYYGNYFHGKSARTLNV